ncbi:MAG: lipase family alpha/beta hydrolase [Blastocatellia bacterium]
MPAPPTTNRPAPTIVFPAAAILLAIASAVALTGCRNSALKPNLPQIYALPAARREGKPPVIFIPGILGSRLVNRRTGETVWPDLRVDHDEIALPISSPVLTQNTDDLAATEIVEEVKLGPFIPETAIYGPLLNALERYGGYRRASFNAPPSGGDSDTLYPFAYDWRRDIVESARALSCAIEDLKRRLGRPDLRFDIVAHSMGGLVARYYAMYGERDVLDGHGACPDWSGSRNLNKVVMIGTPNAGSMNAFRVLLHGFSATAGARPSAGFWRRIKRKLPIARVGPRTTFTAPAVYQLFPPNGQARFFDADLKPLPVDLYDVETWRRFKWSVAFDEALRRHELERLIKRLGPDAARAESLRRLAERERFLRVVLRRAAAFHNALAVACPPPVSLRFFFIGGDCTPTLDGAIILNGGARRTIFNASNFPGETWSKRKAMELIFTPGDGTVTRHSLFGHTLNERPAVAVPIAMRSTLVGTALLCDSHNGLSRDREMHNNLLTSLLINR